MTTELAASEELAAVVDADLFSAAAFLAILVLAAPDFAALVLAALVLAAPDFAAPDFAVLVLAVLVLAALVLAALDFAALVLAALVLPALVLPALDFAVLDFAVLVLPAIVLAGLVLLIGLTVASWSAEPLLLDLVDAVDLDLVVGLVTVARLGAAAETFLVRDVLGVTNNLSFPVRDTTKAAHVKPVASPL